MSQGPVVLPGWFIVEGTGSIQADVRTGLYRCVGGVGTVRSCDHEPVDAERLGFGEVEVSCDVAGELELTWELAGGSLAGPLRVRIHPGHHRTARFSLYAEPTWTGRINAVRISFPAGYSEGMIGPFGLFGFSDLDARHLQRFAQASATMEVARDQGLRVSVRYNGVYLAPSETSKWVQVSLRDDRDREILSVTKPARGNYDARWIEADFVFPDIGEIPRAEVFLIDNGTGHSIACRVEPKVKRER